MVLGVVLLCAGPVVAWALRRAAASLRRFGIPFLLLFLSLSCYSFSNVYPSSWGPNLVSQAGNLMIVAVLWLAVEAIRWLLTLAILERFLNFTVETITKNIITAALYIAAILVLLPWVFGIQVTTVLTTSAILTVIIGLALQDLLGNLFAGVALNIEMPFRKGDWVQIGEHIGAVKEISWRSTKISTLIHDLIVIPNSVVSKSVVQNFSLPTRRDILVLMMGVAYDAPPNKVRNVLKEACYHAKDVLNNPEPVIRVKEYGDSSINYELRVWIHEYSCYKDARDQVYSLIWYLFRRHNITIPYPVRDIHIKTASHKEDVERKALFEAQKARQLREVELFSSLDDEDIALLASESPSMRFGEGEMVVKQGDPGDSFFLIRSGKISIVVDGASNKRIALAELNEGSYLGATSLLTGEPRNATAIAATDTELLVISKETFNKVLVSKPEIASELGRLLAERQLDREAKLAASENMAPKMPTAERERQLHERFFRKIKQFFQI